MRQQVQTETKFILAKNQWAAKRILHRVRKGELEKAKVFFDSDTEAYGRRSHMPLNMQRQFSVFKINWVEKVER